MAHIVYVTNGMSSNLNTSFEVARRLEAAGHRVTYASRESIDVLVTSQGFDYVQLGEPRKDEKPTSRARENGSRWARLLSWLPLLWTRRTRLKNAVEALDVGGFADALRNLSPDLVLFDIEMHAHIVAAAPLRVPTALMIVWFSIWKRPGLPPLHEDLVPGEGWRSRMQSEWAWARFRIKRWVALKRAWLRRAGTDRLSVLRCLARQTGFPFRTEIERYQWLIPCSYRTLPVLCLNAWEMEFPHVPRRGLHYVGPMIREDRCEPQVDVAAEEHLKALFARCRRSGGPKTLIYGSLGTYWSPDRSFLQRIIRAVEERPDWDLILGLGGLLDQEALGRLPPNVHAFPWVPQLRVLQHADCALTHGGISTINECVHFGVPMVVYSSKHVDQNGCAARVAYHGLGIVADKDRDDEVLIRQRVEHVLATPSYRAQLSVMRAHFDAYKGEDRVVRVLEHLLEA